MRREQTKARGDDFGRVGQPWRLPPSLAESRSASGLTPVLSLDRKFARSTRPSERSGGDCPVHVPRPSRLGRAHGRREDRHYALSCTE